MVATSTTIEECGAAAAAGPASSPELLLLLAYTVDANEMDELDRGTPAYLAGVDLEAPPAAAAPAYRHGLSGRDLAECPLLLLLWLLLLLLLLILVLLPRLLKKRENGKLDCFDDDLETPLDATPPPDDKASWDALIPCAYGKFNKLLLLFLLGIAAAAAAVAAAPTPTPPPPPTITPTAQLSLSGTSKAVLFGGGFMYVLVSSA